MDDKIKISPAEASSLAPHIWELVKVALAALPGGLTRGEVRKILKEAEDLSRAIRAVL